LVSIAPGAAVYLDTNALIYLTEGTEAFRSGLEPMLRAAMSVGARLVTSELAITEVLVAPLRRRDDAMVAAYDELFDAFVTAVPITRSMLVRAARLRAETQRLRTPDAIHLAAAQALRAQWFVTGDADIAVSAPMRRHLLTASPPAPRRER
jgi:predicted nucleic acid-binding protein